MYGQVDVAGQQVIALGGLHAHVGSTVLAKQQIAGGGSQLALVHATAHGRVALRIQIDQQHALGCVGQGSGQVAGGRGLADATLLVGDGDDAGHAGVPRRRVLGPVIMRTTGPLRKS
ncbi:hypothetical protein G6F40_016841 [Rhizopus arrhizus]|nr:hypothetical protein G6F40_016841 [Rhizopus arrhizus]